MGWTGSEGAGPLAALSTALHEWLVRARTAGVVGAIDVDEFERAIWGVLLFSPGGAEPGNADARGRTVRALFRSALEPARDAA
jgi:hypothetical protein